MREGTSTVTFTTPTSFGAISAPTITLTLYGVPTCSLCDRVAVKTETKDLRTLSTVVGQGTKTNDLHVMLSPEND